MLETCLNSVGESRGGADVVSVCFDEETTEAHHGLAEQFPWVEFYRSRPHSIGPYVSRESFLRSGAAPLVVFQDSDDAPTVSRRQTLISQLLETGTDLIGSHEIHVNEISRQVHAVRYPVNVSAALAASEGHTLLLPTAAGRREAIKAAGGFSTNRIFNSDLEFVFRAFFFLKLRNVDEFLYIRRIRAGSLTQAPETGIFSPAREAHSAAIRNDLGRIKRKELSLEESALRTQHRSDFGEIRIDRLRPRRSWARLCRDAIRTRLDDLRELSQLLRRQARLGTFGPVVDEPLRTSRVEAMDPVAQRLAVHAADLRRHASIHAVPDRRQRQKPPALIDVPRPTRKRPKLLSRIILSQSDC